METTTGLAARKTPVAAPLFAAVFLALVVQVPATARPPLTLRFAFAAAAAAVGVPLLLHLAVRRRDVTARIGVAALGWAVLSTIVSGSPVAWFGDFFALTGMVFVAACFGAWAIGRALPHDARAALPAAVLAGAVLNAAIAVAQGFVDLTAFEVALYDGRATGLLGNPVFLGGLCAAAMAFVPVAFRWNLVAGAGATALLAAATQMSGARNSLAAVVLVAAWAATRVDRVRRVALVVALVAGLAVGVTVEPTHGTGAVARLNTGSGLANRLENWREGMIAAAERPVVGHGPGRYGPAVSPHRTADLAKEGPDRLYADAHNVVVEYAVTLGLVGLALMLCWAVAAVRAVRNPVRGDLLVAAAALLSSHFVQPQHLILTPLLALLVGAATGAGPHAVPTGRAMRTAQVVLLLVAATVAGRIGIGDVRYRTAEVDFDLPTAKDASALLWPWARPVTLETRIHLFRVREQKDPSELTLALETARRARDREPADYLRHVAEASILHDLRREPEALRAYAAALERNPWSVQALTGKADVLTALARHSQAHACRAAAEVQTRSGSGLRRSHSECLEA